MLSYLLHVDAALVPKLFSWNTLSLKESHNIFPEMLFWNNIYEASSLDQIKMTEFLIAFDQYFLVIFTRKGSSSW